MQRSFDDLGTPLPDVTFCVVDLETTGSSAERDTITEFGAVKVRGGEVLGTFHTLVNPGRAIPPEITLLTGITESMVGPAPRVEAVLPAFVEFAQGTVLVGHNVRFDAGFLNAALERDGWPRLAHSLVDTAALSRRLLADEVPNCRLGTLASRLRLDHRPTHRALDDALATTDLLHLLLERAASFGVYGLDDLLALPRMEAHPQAAKLRLTTHLPRTPGVYLFVGARGEVLYVGKAANLRQRVRSYFSTDERRKVHGLLREATAIHHLPCSSTLEAAVVEIRLIHEHQPRYNRQGRRSGSYQYLKLTLNDAFPRLAVTRRAANDGSVYVGPVSSAAVARLLAEAIHSVAPLRRCAVPLPRSRSPAAAPKRAAPCLPAQLGVAPCPCAGVVDRGAYDRAVALVIRGLTEEPAVLLDPLRDRMAGLAVAERYEEAADVRDRAAALAAALARQRRLDSLRQAGVVRLALPGGAGAELCNGVLQQCWAGAPAAAAPKRGVAADAPPAAEPVAIQPRLALGPGPPAPDLPLPPELADEVGGGGGLARGRGGQGAARALRGRVGLTRRPPADVHATPLASPSMGDVLAAMLIATLIVMATAAAMGAWGVSRLRRRNLVSVRHRVKPPLPWLVSPQRCARLHRRLRDAVATMRMVVPRSTRRHKPPAELAELARAADELEAHAAALDGDLVIAARLRGTSGIVLRARLGGQVGDVERVAARITAAAGATSPRRSAQPTPEALAELSEQLDALEAARDELARLEARVGLVTSP